MIVTMSAYNKWIDVISTGGTFDKIYDPIAGELGFPDESHVPEILENAGVDPKKVKHVPLMSIDSLEMTDWHRREIAKTVDRSNATDGIVITHGTDRMIETAEHLSTLDALADRAIMLTGALLPYSIGTRSDASFNLSFALAMVNTTKKGVYIAMHGEVFRPHQVEKDKKIGRFVGRAVSLEELAARPR
jgi:L-asparaginase